MKKQLAVRPTTASVGLPIKGVRTENGMAQIVPYTAALRIPSLCPLLVSQSAKKPPAYTPEVPPKKRITPYTMPILGASHPYVRIKNVGVQII